MAALAVLQHAHLHPREGCSHDRALLDPVRLSVLRNQPWCGVGNPPHGKGARINRSAAPLGGRRREEEGDIEGGLRINIT